MARCVDNNAPFFLILGASGTYLSVSSAMSVGGQSNRALVGDGVGDENPGKLHLDQIIYFGRTNVNILDSINPARSRNTWM